MTAASKALFMAARAARVFAFGYVNRLNWKNKAASPRAQYTHIPRSRPVTVTACAMRG